MSQDEGHAELQEWEEYLHSLKDGEVQNEYKLKKDGE